MALRMNARRAGQPRGEPGRCFDQALATPGRPGAPSAWDSFLAAAPGGDIVQSDCWGEAKRAMGFEVARVVCRDADGAIEGGALIVARKLASMRGLETLGAVGYISRGPVMRNRDESAALRVLDEIERTARAMRIRHLIIQPPAGQEHLVPLLAERGYDEGTLDVAPSCTLMLDLAPDTEAIIAAMSPKMRRNLRHMLRRGAKVREGDASDLPAFQALHAVSARRQGFNALSLDYLRRHWQALHPAGALTLFMAHVDDAPHEPVAGGWVTAFAGVATDRIPAWNGGASKHQPNMACVWHSIVHAKAQGHRYFDFGGIDRRLADVIRRRAFDELDGAQRGSVAFKVRFGGEVVMLPRARQKTFNPVARPFVHLGFNTLQRFPSLRGLANRVRNG